MRTRILRAVVAALTIVPVACSDDPGGDPEARAGVLEAIRALADPAPARIRLQLPYATADDLHQLSVGIEPEVAEVFEGARLTIENDFAIDPLRAHFSMKLHTEAGSVEARQIEDDLYLRGISSRSRRRWARTSAHSSRRWRAEAIPGESSRRC